MIYLLACKNPEQQGCPDRFLQPGLAHTITKDDMKGKSLSATLSTSRQMFNKRKSDLRIAKCEPSVYCLTKGYCSHIWPGSLLLVFSVNVWVFRAV